MRYVTYDESGSLTGCYLQEIAPDHANNYIEIDEALANQWANYRANDDRSKITELPPAVPSKNQINAPILAQLEALDAKSIRPLREGDSVRVTALEQQAAALRLQLIK